MNVHIIMGSQSDKEIAQKAASILKEFGVSYNVSVISAHRALDTLQDVVQHSSADVFIGIAGKAAHLSGVIAGMTTKPVIGVPVKSSTLGGLEALLSTVEMPSGVPVATVAINGGENAGILATQILAVGNPELQQKLKDHKQSMLEAVQAMDDAIGEL